VTESPEEQTIDKVNVELFDRKTEDDLDIGENNMLSLSNALNEQKIRFAEPMNAPRSGETVNVWGHERDKRIDETSSVADVNTSLTQTMDAETAVTKVREKVDARSIAPSPDVWDKPNPFNGQIQSSPFIPAVEQSSVMKQETPSIGENNFLKFKRQTNTQRIPDMPEMNPARPTLAPDYTLKNIRDNGFFSY
jgi:hypothetical protein